MSVLPHLGNFVKPVQTENSVVVFSEDRDGQFTCISYLRGHSDGLTQEKGVFQESHLSSKKGGAGNLSDLEKKTILFFF